MQVDLSPRGSGKTEKLIRESAEECLSIVCSTTAEARRIADIAIGLGLVIPYPISFNEFRGYTWAGRNVKGFLIDNADLLLERMAGNTPIKKVTMTLEK